MSYTYSNDFSNSIAGTNDTCMCRSPAVILTMQSSRSDVALLSQSNIKRCHLWFTMCVRTSILEQASTTWTETVSYLLVQDLLLTHTHTHEKAERRHKQIITLLLWGLQCWTVYEPVFWDYHKWMKCGTYGLYVSFPAVKVLVYHWCYLSKHININQY